MPGYARLILVANAKALILSEPLQHPVAISKLIPINYWMAIFYNRNISSYRWSSFKAPE